MKFTRYLLFATMIFVVCLVSSALAQGAEERGDSTIQVPKLLLKAVSRK